MCSYTSVDADEWVRLWKNQRKVLYVNFIRPCRVSHTSGRLNSVSKCQTISTESSSKWLALLLLLLLLLFKIIEPW